MVLVNTFISKSVIKTFYEYNTIHAPVLVFIMGYKYERESLLIS